MTQAAEKTEKSPAAPPDPAAPEDARAAFHARIAAARARVNGLLAAQARPPLPDWPLPDPADETHTNGETGALKFLEVVANPEVYRNCPPNVAPGALAGGIRAGLQTLAQARGAPKPDFSAEDRAPETAYAAASETASDAASERARLLLAKARRRQVYDEASYDCAAAHGGLTPFSLDVPPYGEPQPRLPDPAQNRAGFALPDAPALSARGPDETEALLNGVIGDCRLFLREIVFHSARLAALESDRTGFIDAACRVAQTAGGVGKQIAKLRRAANNGQMGENRQRIIVERVERIPARMIVEGEEGA